MRIALKLVGGLLLILAVMYLAIGLVSVSQVNLGPSKEQVQKAIEDQNYTEVVVLDKVWFGSTVIHGCGGEDVFAFPFTAKNAQGNQIEAAACTGYIWKGVTIRSKIPSPKK